MFDLFKVGVTYNVDKVPTENSFEVKVYVRNADKNEVKAQSCVRYTGDGENSGMAIMEFGLPSGFSLDQDHIDKVGLRHMYLADLTVSKRPGTSSFSYF